MSLSDRFELVEFADGSALLVDLDSGEIRRLNRSASWIAGRLLAGAAPPSAIEKALADRFGITVERARSDITSVADALRREAEPPRPRSVHFAREDKAFVLVANGVRLALLDPEGGWVEPLPAEPGAARHALSCALPHVLVLGRVPVLHAAAVEVEGRCIAFAGATGAGKTTLAECFARSGERLVSRDLVLLDLEGSPPRVRALAEAWLEGWMEDALAQGDTTGRIATASLAGIPSRPSTELAEVWWLDASRRRGSALVLAALPGPDALVHLLENSFAEIATKAAFSDALAWSRALVESTPVLEATLPDGLGALAAALSDRLAARKRG